MNTFIQFTLEFMKNSKGCLFHKVTGLYCPGCGGTRALYLFLTNQWWASFRFHPLVLYLFGCAVYFALRYLVALFQFATKREPITYRPKSYFLWIALVLLLANFIIKNIALIFFHVNLLV